MRIIWVARFIKWKHPEVVLKLAKNLKKQNYSFKIQMLGAGALEEKTKKKIKKMNLEDVVEVVGQVPSEKVKDYMEKANLFIGTSGSYEGWGAVINESMNAACAIVANKKMGSVPFLIGENETGLMYEGYQDLENKVKLLMENKELRQKLSRNAYQYITTKWTGEIAADNLLQLFEAVIHHTEANITEGPASKME